jgi:pimeloyl-ACP methyl ester carboxylesterase
MSIRERRVRAGDITLNVAECGAGRPLLLLHGWPEFWLTWEPVMQRLADRFRLIAPDLRGFGDSDKDPGPTDQAGADRHAVDMRALLDALDVPRAGIVGHDVGGPVSMALARLAPERCAGLFYFNFVHAAVGARLGAPDRLREIWYQSFHQMDFAPALVGASRDTCRAYIGHFLRHWAHRKDAFDDVLETWVDNFLKPGNLQGGFNYYRSAHAGRIAIMRGESPVLPPITLPACVRWTTGDAIFPLAFSEGLDQTFADLDFAPFPDAGHFPHRETPDRAAAEIARFFDRVWPSP